MRISAKIDYACRALLELSLHWPNRDPMQINTIGENQGIPIKFLTQILLNLKNLGYVESLRGKRGGYRLAQPPRDLSLSRVIEEFGGIGYSMTDGRQYDNPQHVIARIWQEIDQVVDKELQKLNFEILVNRYKTQEKILTYNI